MSIKRSARKRNFTTLDNAVFSAGLSFRAIGLLTYLLSKPDHWEVSVAHLVNVSATSKRPDGRDSVYAIINELIEAGFIVRTLTQGEGGKMAGYDYEVFDVPQTPCTAKPETAEPDTAAPSTANPTQVNTDVQVNTEPSANTESIAEKVDPFDEAWKLYPKRQGGNPKADAKKAWDARVKAGVDPLIMIEGVKRYAEFCSLTDKVGTEYVMQAQRFFGKSEQYMEPWSVSDRRGNDRRGGDRRQNHTNFQEKNYGGTPDDEIPWLNGGGGSPA